VGEVAGSYEPASTTKPNETTAAVPLVDSATVAGVVEITELKVLPLMSRTVASSAGVIAVSLLAALWAAAASRSGAPQHSSASSSTFTDQVPSAFWTALTVTSAALMPLMPRTVASPAGFIAFSWSVTLWAAAASRSGAPQHPSASSLTFTDQVPSAFWTAVTVTSAGSMSTPPMPPAPPVPPTPPTPPYTAYA